VTADPAVAHDRRAVRDQLDGERLSAGQTHDLIATPR
jgi:hypothetical protein